MQTSISITKIYEDIDQQIDLIVRCGDVPQRVFVSFDVASALRSHAITNMRNPYCSNGPTLLRYLSAHGQLDMLPRRDCNYITVEGYLEALAEKELLLDET